MPDYEQRLRDIEAQCGHPGDKWEALTALIQNQSVKKFADIESEWIHLIWTLDRYRIEGLPPRGMGKANVSAGKRLAAIYRGKGNWFAETLALLLGNQTHQRLAPRTKVVGFSQEHQIDVAWPDRKVDPLVCLETKVTGAPAYGDTRARGAMSDWSNRRKELKFAATDLKLFRRQQDTAIEHWDVWRASQPPKTYFLWAARMREGDKIERMVREVQALVNTYLEGAGIFAWRDNDAGMYEPVAVPHTDRVASIDDVLWKIASEIKAIAPPGTEPPPAEEPAKRAVDVKELAADELQD